MSDMHGRILSVIECKNPSCGQKITRQGYPTDWPDDYVAEDHIHSGWNDDLTAFCVYCENCGHYTGNKIDRSKKKD